MSFEFLVDLNLRTLLFSLLIFTGLTQTNAQGPAIGEWHSHFPYRLGRWVIEAGTRIYCSSEAGLFYFDQNDNSLHTISRENGASGISVSSMAYSAQAKTLIVAYSDGELDFISEDGTLFSLPDIKNKNIIGDKVVHSIVCEGTTAYLSAAFGLVRVNLLKKEIKDNYSVALDSSKPSVNVAFYQVALQNGILYASTSLGLFSISPNDNLADVSHWQKVLSYSASSSHLVSFNNRLVLSNTQGGKDTLFTYPKGNDSLLPVTSQHVYGLNVNYGKLLISIPKKGYELDTSFQVKDTLKDYFILTDPRMFIRDRDGRHWVADNFAGLCSVEGKNAYTPDGIATNDAFSTSSAAHTVYVVSGGYNTQEAPIYNHGFSYFRGGRWKQVTPYDVDNAAVENIVDIAEDPSAPNHFFAANYEKGIAEFRDNKVVQFYDNTNSSLLKGAARINVTCLAYDSQNTLWAAQSHSSYFLHALTPDGNWKGFLASPFDFSGDIITSLVIDNADQKWMTMSPRSSGKLAVFKEESAENPGGVKVLNISLSTTQGEVSATPYCLAKDLDGTLWVGTNFGVAAFFSPEVALTSEDFSAKSITVEHDSFVESLLELETVTSVAVDGANRKWFGTLKSGVFLFSADGTKELLHFTEENSPLLSNQINSISVNPENGEVFFATLKGTISYHGTATEGSEDFSNVFAFPNPVARDFTGSIGIKGLVANVSVKITDIAGRLVYETKANGGQAIWNVRDFSGNRVHSGVYLIYATDETGEQTVVTKITVL